MPIPEKTAVLVISFGTSYPETRKKTIEKIEKYPAGLPGSSLLPCMDQPQDPGQT